MRKIFGVRNDELVPRIMRDATSKRLNMFWLMGILLVVATTKIANAFRPLRN